MLATHIFKIRNKSYPWMLESKQKSNPMVDGRETENKKDVVGSGKTQHFLGPKSESEVQFNQEGLGCQFCDIKTDVASFTE